VGTKTTEFRIAGFGGQGVILAGTILGKAATLFEGRQATLMQSFGPEARGGSCSAQVILSDAVIGYPYVGAVDVLVALSQDAFERFVKDVRSGGMLVYEEDLVKVHDVPAGVRSFGVPATRFAEQLKRKMVLNIVMTGFVTAVTGAVDVAAARKAVADSVPRGTEPLNLSAFDKGFEFGRELLAKEPGTGGGGG
jgi:2-oxoglutarate ferredoxin oxidoreductase subunit gamma